MLRRISLAGLGLWMAALPASAQVPCSVGVYTEPDGTGHFIPAYVYEPTQFNLYVVAFAEDAMSAVAYGFHNPDPSNILVIDESFGPNGNGINIRDEPGLGANNVGLGECAVGVGGQPILVATYTMLMLPSYPYGEFCVTPNPYRTETDPTKCQYSSCQDELEPCDIGPCVYMDLVDPAESSSFGAVKALYR
jgi:hypothetical protein